VKRYPAVLAAFYNTPQLITVDKFNEIAAFLEAAAGGELAMKFDAETHRPLGELVAVDDGEHLAIDQVPASGQAQRQFVAVLPLFGTLMQHADMMMDFSGGTSTDAWARDLKKLDANPSVKTVVIEAHTPGGQVWGTQEAADVVRKVRDAGKTRIVSVANSMMASAGLWIGTAADQVYVTPGGTMGSLGVVSMHQDISKFEEQKGLKTTLVATPARKILGHEYAPLDDEARAELVARNEATYQRFVQAMAANRRVTPEQAEANFGGGAMLRADEAVQAGLADGIATMAEVLDQELARLKGGEKATRRSMRAELAIARAKTAD